MPNAKATHIFTAKILAYMPYLIIKVLTIRQLTTLLVLNNWAQVFFLQTVLLFFLFLHENVHVHVCCGYSSEISIIYVFVEK